MTTQLLILENILWLPLCGINKFGLNTLPSKTVAIPYTCGLSDTLSPLVAMHHIDRSCMILGIFLKLPHSPTVASEPGLCIDVICMSRTQRVVGHNSHTTYHQRLTLIRRYCWMKRPELTLHDRVHETGSTDVLCTPVASGCQLIQLS